MERGRDQEEEESCMVYMRRRGSEYYKDTLFVPRRYQFASASLGHGKQNLIGNLQTVSYFSL